MFIFAIEYEIDRLRNRKRDNNMKKILYIILVCSFLTSCVPSIYYQMYQTQPMSDNIIVNENALVYEDDNCAIIYDFWGENGDFSFVINNKTTENLYLHLDECFYVKNGFAYDYYKIETTNLSFIFENNTKIEKRAICIPPKYSKMISEYSINENIYRDCDLSLYPNKNDNNTLNFTKEDSPFVFGNKLAYTVGDSESIHRINNIFYVSKISNYSNKEITELVVIKDYCGNTYYNYEERSFKDSGPDKFYIKYEYDPNSNSIKYKH